MTDDLYMRDPDEAFDDAIKAGVLLEPFAGDWMYMCSVLVPGGVDDQFKHRISRQYVHHVRLGAVPGADKLYAEE